MLLLEVLGPKLYIVLFALLLWGIPYLIIRWISKHYQDKVDELHRLRKEVKELKKNTQRQKTDSQAIH